MVIPTHKERGEGGGDSPDTARKAAISLGRGGATVCFLGIS